jgi:hypothetical protein
MVLTETLKHFQKFIDKNLLTPLFETISDQSLIITLVKGAYLILSDNHVKVMQQTNELLDIEIDSNKIPQILQKFQEDMIDKRYSERVDEGNTKMSVDNILSCIKAFGNTQTFGNTHQRLAINYELKFDQELYILLELDNTNDKSQVKFKNGHVGIVVDNNWEWIPRINVQYVQQFLLSLKKKNWFRPLVTQHLFWKFASERLDKLLEC